MLMFKASVKREMKRSPLFQKCARYRGTPGDLRNAVALTPYSCLSEVARFEEKSSEYCRDFHSANATKFFDARPSSLQPNTKAPPHQNGHRV